MNQTSGYIYVRNHPSYEVNDVIKVGKASNIPERDTQYATALATTYEKARKIIADKNIKSKESYYELCERDNRLSKEPEIVFKGQFTNWIEYLSIERVYYDLETCIEKVNNLLILHNEIKTDYLNLSIVCKKLCKLDNNFPPNDLWVEYYNVNDLRDIIIINNKKKKLLF